MSLTTRRRFLVAATATAGAALTAQPAHAAARVPGDVLDMRYWSWQSPLSDGEGGVEEVEPPRTASFTHRRWLTVADGAVVLTAPADGATTENSKHPRSEYREYTRGGRKAAWSTRRGRHLFVVRFAVTQLPAKHRKVIPCQVHSGEDDLACAYLDDTILSLRHDGEDVATITEDYQLEEWRTVAYLVADGRLSIAASGKLRYEAPVEEYDEANGKAGAYVQTNDGEKGEDPDEVGQVALSRLQVAHR